MFPSTSNSGRGGESDKQESDRPTKKSKTEEGYIPDNTTGTEVVGGEKESSSADKRKREDLTIDTSQPPDDDKTLAECIPDIEEYIKKGISKAEKANLDHDFRFKKISILRSSENWKKISQQSVDFDLDYYFLTGKVQPPADPEIGRLCNAMQDFGFDEKLTHSEDVDAFMVELQTAQEWHTDQNIRDDFLAPILPVIQSSGTGKSRLLYEARKFGNSIEADRDRKRKNSSPVAQGSNEPNIKHHYRSILLTHREKDVIETKKYDKVHWIKSLKKWDGTKREKERQALRELVEEQCKTCSVEKGEHYVTLLFDEAQHLTMNDNGFLFKALRWMTREKRFSTKESSEAVYRITVVVAGTSSSLADCFPETTIESKGVSSRYNQNNDSHYVHGKKLYSPFFILRTQGCLSKRKDGCKGSTSSEFEKMIRFSRPLFAKLHREGIFTNESEYDIAHKILLYKTRRDWFGSRQSCFSVLATRVQMGTTSTSIVSTLVSKGYAHLTYFQQGDEDVPNNASFAFLPDPVCARMAMCLTDENWNLKRSQPSSSSKSHTLVINGMPRKRIVEMMGTIISDGMCLPAKGDFGEIAVALYLLFCGDVLREQHNMLDEPNKHSWYRRLSVDLSRWMGTVWKGGQQTPSNYTKWDRLHVNCIQFFRQSLSCSLSDLGKQSFLQSLYEKGCAVYCAANTEAIDAVIPCFDGPNDDYLPVYISIKNYASIYPKEAVDFLKTSYIALIDSGVGKGLLLLGIAGQDRLDVDCSMYEMKWRERWEQASKQNASSTETSTAFGRGDDILITENTIPETRSIHNDLLVGFFLVHNDEFGIHDMLKKTSFVKMKQKAELYAMHSELIHGGSSDVFQLPRNYRNDAQLFFSETKGCVDKQGLPDSDGNDET